MPYHDITYDMNFEQGQIIRDYVMGLIPPTVAWKGVKELEDKVFDSTVFWNGEPFEGVIPDFVKLIIKKEDEDKEICDYLPNPISWLLFSERFIDFACPLIKDDIQIFDPPIFRESDGARVSGYKLINPIRLIDCMDLDKTNITRAKDGHIKFCSNIHIKEDCVGDHHIFRIKGYFPPVLFSDEFAKATSKKGFTGFAFIRCGIS